MEEHRIKSAVEIAMEKVAKMPGLTQDEIAGQKEQEYRPVGEALARRYLEGAMRRGDLPVELGKYRGSDGQIVKQAFVSSLCRAVDLARVDKSQRALEGIGALVGASNRIQELIAEFEEVSGEFEREMRRKRETIEAVQRERLRTLGISGSAIKPNLTENQDWCEAQGQIRQAYGLKLDKLRKSLMEISQVT